MLVFVNLTTYVDRASHVDDFSFASNQDAEVRESRIKFWKHDVRSNSFVIITFNNNRSYYLYSTSMSFFLHTKFLGWLYQTLTTLKYSTNEDNYHNFEIQPLPNS